MKTSLSLSITFLACSALFGGTPQDAVRILDTAPLRFEPGPAGGDASFVARGARYRFSFTGNRATFQANGKKIALQFMGGASQARFEGLQKERSTTAAYFGNDPSKWRKAIPNYSRLQVSELYRGIDLVYYGNAGELEYDLMVKPGADPAQIRLRFEGTHPRLDRDGNLVSDVIQKRPVAYQLAANGSKVPVSSRYRKQRDGSYGFELGAYDRERELVIDPVLTFSTYISGGFQDIAYSIGHDRTGFLYVSGTTGSVDFPLAGSSYQITEGGGLDIFLTKIDPNAAPGSQIVYSTYLGGENNEAFGDMAVSPNGEVYLTGTTASGLFPQVNTYQTALSGGTDAFVVWFDSGQNLGYSSYFGGTGLDSGSGVTYDAAGHIYVVGSTASTDLPTLNSYQTTNAGSQDVFLAVFDKGQSGTAALTYSTYFGGGAWDTGRGIALAPDGTVWIVGSTYSGDFPAAGIPYQSNYSGGGDAFAAQFNVTFSGNPALYVTYLGGSGTEEARRVAVDANGALSIVGYTTSTNFPVTSSALQPKYGGNTDAFITKLNPANPSSKAQLVYSTYFGGAQADSIYDIKQDASGILYMAGFTTSAGLPTTPNALQLAFDGTWDAFALKLDPSIAGKAGINYLTYLGSPGLQVGYGTDFDATGKMYLTGYTSGPIFDALSGAPKPSDHGNVDGFLAAFPTCAFDTNIHSEQFPNSGGSDTITIIAVAGGTCTWTASSPVSWVTVAPGSGTGAGSVTIKVSDNTTGASRKANLSIAGTTFVVGQDQ